MKKALRLVWAAVAVVVAVRVLDLLLAPVLPLLLGIAITVLVLYIAVRGRRDL